MTYFVFCIHNHQPVGNFGNVMEDAYESSYWPFLKALSKHPAIKLTLHTSGFLLDWLVKNRPEYIETLRRMVHAGQVEIMGGGYYEPILPVIPEADRVAQIRMMSDKIEELFQTRPRGIWLAERVWEPALPTTLRKAGIEYLLVDDYHFIKSGLSREALGGYYITEDQGNVIKIFPGSEALRYLIPFKPVDALEEHLRGIKSAFKKGNAAIYGDDGEKFGVWPGTGKWVFDEGWLESFFEKIEKSLDWIKPANLSEYLDSEDPVGRIYLPTCSYMEMGEWSLPPEASRDFSSLMDEIKSWREGERVRRYLQGGTWRNFFSKYPESNWMHKRMVFVSGLLNRRSEGRVWDDSLSSAEQFLYRAQCNDAYWHGVFGGLYLPHLRAAVYENLLRAEELAHAEMDLKADGPYVEFVDMDADNHLEALVRTRDLNLFFSPHNGGSLVELDLKPAYVNFSNTLSRWFEGYHHKLSVKEIQGPSDGTKSIHEIIKVKEEGLERYLKYDSIRRASFIDHFLGEDETLEAFFENTHRELGDFHDKPYEASFNGGRLSLSRAGHAAERGFEVRKDFVMTSENAFRAEYTVKSSGKPPEEGALRFGVEMNLMLPCCDGPACLYESIPPISDSQGIGLGSTGKTYGVEEVGLLDTFRGVRLDIRTDKPATLWRFPVHTVSLSEGGFEKIYQGSCLLFLFPLSLEGGAMRISFDMKAEKISK